MFYHKNQMQSPYKLCGKSTYVLLLCINQKGVLNNNSYTIRSVVLNFPKLLYSQAELPQKLQLKRILEKKILQQEISKKKLVNAKNRSFKAVLA